MRAAPSSAPVRCSSLSSPTIVENVDKASMRLRLDSDNVAGVHLPVFKAMTEGAAHCTPSRLNLLAYADSARQPRTSSVSLVVANRLRSAASTMGRLWRPSFSSHLYRLHSSLWTRSLRSLIVVSMRLSTSCGHVSRCVAIVLTLQDAV